MRSLHILLLTLTTFTLGSPHKADSATILTRADSPSLSDVYDYIIIGGGTAGLTVADRLTEDGKTTVIVIEYGELSSSSSITTLRGGISGMTDPTLQYTINSVPQLNLRNRSSPVMIGKVVGGSSAINAMMTIRGTSEDYDRWGAFFSLPSNTTTTSSPSSSWSWSGLLPYFRRALTFIPPPQDVAKSANISYDQRYWGNTSSVCAGWPSFQFPASTVLLEAFRNFEGVEFAGDSGAGRPGLTWYPTFMDPVKGERSYARTGHHDVAAKRGNYVLLTGTKVQRVVVEGRRAVGVEFEGTGEKGGEGKRVVKARKEVILAAGAIHSPQVLQLSGIGPRELLEKVGIEVKVELPGVGQNFQDHTTLSASWSFRSLPLSPSSSDLYTNTTFANLATTLWSTNRTGPYSLATGNSAAFLPFPIISSRASTLSTSLLSQNHTLYLPPSVHPTVAAGYAFQMRLLASALTSNSTAFYNLVMTGGASSGMLIDLHPLSRGTVNINPSSPNSEPLVDYRVLTNPLDAIILADILRFTRRYFTANRLTQGYRPMEYSPGGRVATDEEIAAYLVDSLSPSYFHPVGTCAMMPKELGGVVDEQLKVYGVEGLRVVDASVISLIPGANTCQTVYAVAEKAADLIRGV